MEKFVQTFGEPVTLAEDYQFMITYEYPGPLPVGYNSGYSSTVDAGPSLGGTGQFYNYLVLKAGLVATIFYERFVQIA